MLLPTLPILKLASFHFKHTINKPKQSTIHLHETTPLSPLHHLPLTYPKFKMFYLFHQSINLNFQIPYSILLS